LSWETEHGREFAVPTQVYMLEGIVDLSWHNDVCPRFTTNDEGIGANLFVDHPDPNKREMGPDVKRFLVLVQVHDCQSTDDQVVCETDDMEEAIAAFVDAAIGWTRRN
jgi:hypothetical protein